MMLMSRTRKTSVSTGKPRKGERKKLEIPIGQNKPVKKKSPIRWVILASVIVIAFVIPISLFGSIGMFYPVSESNNVTFKVVNGVSGEDLSSNFTTRIYWNDSEVLGKEDLLLYKEWVLGLNGSAKTALIEFEPGSPSLFFIHFETGMDEYGNFSSFWKVIDRNGKYVVQVYQDPEETNGTFFDGNGIPVSTPSCTEGQNFTMRIDCDKNRYWENIFDADYSLVEYKALILNLTFNKNLTASSVDLVLEKSSSYGVLNGSAIQIDSPGNASSIAFMIPHFGSYFDYTFAFSENLTLVSATLEYAKNRLWTW